MGERDDAMVERQEAADERIAAARERGRGTDREPGALPEPPWWTSDKRKSARSALSREAIVEAALRVLDAYGLDGLSMRRVADELGTGAASLYWHVANKDQLINILLDRVIGEVPRPEPDPDRWEDQLREFARNGRAAFARHRDLARASMGRIPVGPNLLLTVEWLLALFDRAGIPRRPAAWFGDILSLYIAGYAFEDSVTEADSNEEAEAAMAAYLASIPPDDVPHLVAAAGDLMEGGADERFEFGLDLLIRGLAAHAAAAAQPEPQEPAAGP